MRIAVEGCGHGQLNAIYASVAEGCKQAGWEGVDLLIIGGDFQATRNSYDLDCMAVPPKYRKMGDFHEYYDGTRTAPILTIFIGGNHEASNHSLELFYGGWVAPNIYYMGAAGVIRCGPLRIAGLSGIYGGYDYRRPHQEQLPFRNGDHRSVYHLREYDVERLRRIRTQVDIGISHDWPRGVEWEGDSDALFRIKPYFEREARSNTLGSPVTRSLLDHLRPAYWFSAHLHCKFAAVIDHSRAEIPQLKDANDSALAPSNPADGEMGLPTSVGTGAVNENPEEIELASDTDSVAPVQTVLRMKTAAPSPHHDQDVRTQLPASFTKTAVASMPTSISNQSTRFLALDKCLPGRQFLQLLQIEPLQEPTSEEDTKPPYSLTYDKEWLALNRVFSNHLALGPTKEVDKSKINAAFMTHITEAEAWVEKNIVSQGKISVPLNFEPIPSQPPSGKAEQGVQETEMFFNPQTAAFCEMLDIPKPFPPGSLGQGTPRDGATGNFTYQVPRGHQGWRRGQSNNRRGHRGGMG